jgi:hypothetical protein
MGPLEPYRMVGRPDQKIYYFDERLARYQPADWKGISNWEEVDKTLRIQIEQHKTKDDYLIGIQQFSLKFLDYVLLNAPASEIRTDAIRYYLEVLIDQGNSYWPVLAKSLMAVQPDLDKGDYADLQGKINLSANNFLDENQHIKKKYFSNNFRNSVPTETGEKELIEWILEAEQCLADLK